MRKLLRGWRRKVGCLAVVIVVVVIANSVSSAYRKWIYPYGWSHCCITQMRTALEDYASTNDGKYPAGETSAEASLSLVYGLNGLDANTLRGMTVPEAMVQSILSSGKKLDSDSCGWNYVPGLTLADNPSLALLWCKMPLNHNGRRSSDGGRQVVFVGGNIDWVAGTKWPEFLAEQGELMNRRSRREIDGLPLVTAQIELPDGSHIEHFEGPYTLRESSRGPSMSGGRTESGSGLTLRKLAWYRAPLLNGVVTRTLAFADFQSEVAVTFAEWSPDQTEVVFKMKPKE